MPKARPFVAPPQAPRGSVLARVAAVISVELGVDEDDITRDSTLGGLGLADDLDVIEIVMALEDEFGIAIDDDIAETFAKARVGEIAAFIERQLGTPSTS